MYEVTIQVIPKISLLISPHTGAYAGISKAFARLFGWLGEHGKVQPGIRSIGIYYDDPSIVPEEKLRSAAGVALPGGTIQESPFEHTGIGGGPHAVLRHKGPYSQLPPVYQWLYGQWLPCSGRQASGAPSFEEYLNMPNDTAPGDLLTDIYLPLRENSPAL